MWVIDSLEVIICTVNTHDVVPASRQREYGNMSVYIQYLKLTGLILPRFLSKRATAAQQDVASVSAAIGMAVGMILAVYKTVHVF